MEIKDEKKVDKKIIDQVNAEKQKQLATHQIVRK
jgi:hypothetical protein